MFCLCFFVVFLQFFVYVVHSDFSISSSLCPVLGALLFFISLAMSMSSSLSWHSQVQHKEKVECVVCGTHRSVRDRVVSRSGPIIRAPKRTPPLKVGSVTGVKQLETWRAAMHTMKYRNLSKIDKWLYHIRVCVLTGLTARVLAVV